MQDLAMFSGLMWEISLGIFLLGLFYVFGMFTLGRLFAAFGEGDADHDVDHDAEHEVDHDVDHEVDHDIDHDIDHEVDHDVEHEADHDIDYDIDHEIDHDVDHDVEHDVDHETEHDIEHGPDDATHEAEHEVEHEAQSEHESGFFETERGAPLGVTIGTTLISFGFLGIVFYSPTVMLAFQLQVGVHLVGVILTVLLVRTVLGRFLVESGFYIEPRHLVGREVEAVSTVSDAFGEIRTETEMGLRRFNARPFQRGSVYQKGTKLYIISAGDRHVFVHTDKDVMKWVHRQSKHPRENERPERLESA